MAGQRKSPVPVLASTTIPAAGYYAECRRGGYHGALW